MTNQLEQYKQNLIKRELSDNSVQTYLRSARQFLDWNDDSDVTELRVIEYKKYLMSKFKLNTVNTKITTLNDFLNYIDKADTSVKTETKQVSNTMDMVLSETDFKRLIRVGTNKGKDRDVAIMWTLYYTGLRISELENVTVQALKSKKIDVNNKGKHRVVPVCKALESILKAYVKAEGIKDGIIFRNSKGQALDRTTIFRALKWIGGQARVKKDKVYPHSFRHLFAKQYLKHNHNNVIALADILGHSSLETTRIYLKQSTDELRETINF